MVYVVIYLDGTSEVVNRNDFPSIDIDKVERVYPGNYEVKIVSELVPLGEEKEKLTETIDAFNQKYNGGVVTTEGLVSFEEWFKNGVNGDTAVIPEKVLVPQKTYRIQKIKDVVEISSGKGAAKIDAVPEKRVEKTEKVEKVEKVEKKPVAKKKKDDLEKQTSIFEAAVEPQTKEQKQTKQPKKSSPGRKK